MHKDDCIDRFIAEPTRGQLLDGIYRRENAVQAGKLFTARACVASMPSGLPNVEHQRPIGSESRRQRTFAELEASFDGG